MGQMPVPACSHFSSVFVRCVAESSSCRVCTSVISFSNLHASSQTRLIDTIKWKLEPDHLILEQNIRRTRQHIKVSETRIKGRWIPNLRLVDYPPTWREQSHPNHVQAQHQNSKHKTANPSLHRYDLDLTSTKQYIDFNMLSQVPFNPNFCHKPRRQGQWRLIFAFMPFLSKCTHSILCQGETLEQTLTVYLLT